MNSKTLVFITFTMSLGIGVIIGQISNKETEKQNSKVIANQDTKKCITNSEFKTSNGDTIINSVSSTDKSCE